MSKLADKIAAKTAHIKVDEEKREIKAHKPLTAPAIQFDATARMHAAEQRAEELQEQLNEALRNGGVVELPLDLLHEEPNRRRTLDPEEYERLKENLRHNDLVTPVVVRIRAKGGYEIVSGHNRTEIFRDLCRTSIPAVISKIGDDKVNRDAFYANLLHSTLPDYEKYLGFRQMLVDHPALTIQELAKSSGYSDSQISRIMTFGDLPDKAHKILKNNPAVIGANLAQELAFATKDGNGEKVIEAIELLSKRQLTQEQAKDFVLKDPKAKSHKEKPVPELVTIKRGKTPYCKYRRVEKVIRLEFKTDAEADAIQSALLQLLEQNAKSAS
jgi:ParB family chromosome partitioning protein